MGAIYFSLHIRLYRQAITAHEAGYSYSAGMTPPATAPNNEPDILYRLEVPMTPEVARSLLTIRFCDQDVARMHELLDKGNQGTISGDEQQEAHSYERIGHLVAMLQSVACRTLNSSAPD